MDCRLNHLEAKGQTGQPRRNQQKYLGALLCILAFLANFVLPIIQFHYQVDNFSGFHKLVAADICAKISSGERHGIPAQPFDKPHLDPYCQDDDDDDPDYIGLPSKFATFCAPLIRRLLIHQCRLIVAGTILSVSGSRSPPISL